MAKKKIGFTFTVKDNTKAAFRTVANGLSKVGISAANVKKGLMVMTAAVIGATVAFIALGKKSFESMDAIQKTADRIGMNADMLQMLQFGAVESGTEIEKLRIGMEKFTKNLGDSAMGMGVAKPILEKYGISLRNAAGELKQTDEILMEVVDALGNTDSALEKNSVLMALFGRTGAQLNALLGQGRDVLDEVRERYERLGLAISKTTLDAVAKANDKFQEFISIGRSVRDQFFGALAPVFTSLIGLMQGMVVRFLEAKGGAEKFGQEIAGNFVGYLVSGIEAAQRFGNAIAKTFFDLRIQFLEATIAFTAFLHTFSQSSLGKMMGLDEFTTQFAEFHNKTIDDLQLLRGTFEKPLDFSAVIASLQEIKPPMTDLVDSFLPTDTFVSKWEAVLGSIKSATATVTLQMTASFTDFFNIMGDKFMDFKNLATSLLKMIITEMTKMWVISTFLPMFGKSKIGQFLGMSVPEGKASGGTVRSGTPYMVGEKGAELFVPNQTGTIVPNNQVGGGGANINVSFNITAWDSKDATQAISQQANNIVAIVENSFRRRGQILGAT
jgi:hypothetical protein